MKTKKISLKEIKGALSRSEMKQIMAGSGDTCQKHGEWCDSNDAQHKYNCCNGLECGDYHCRYPTLAE